MEKNCIKELEHLHEMKLNTLVHLVKRELLLLAKVVAFPNSSRIGFIMLIRFSMHELDK